MVQSVRAEGRGSDRSPVASLTARWPGDDPDKAHIGGCGPVARAAAVEERPQTSEGKRTPEYRVQRGQLVAGMFPPYRLPRCRGTFESSDMTGLRRSRRLQQQASPDTRCAQSFRIETVVVGGISTTAPVPLGEKGGRFLPAALTSGRKEFTAWSTEPSEPSGRLEPLG